MSKKDDEKERQKQLEYRELLKMKQGLIEESEIIPEDGYVEIPKLTGWKWFGNFVYHNKIYIAMALFFIALATVFIVQFVTREETDLYVLVISTSNKSELAWRYGDLEEALERYCPDFDENGYVHVGVNFIDIATENSSGDYGYAQSMKFSSEIYSGNSQFFIADTGLWTQLYDVDKLDFALFEDLSGKASDEMLYKDCGLKINTTGLSSETRWDTCPDSIVIFKRHEDAFMRGSQKQAAEERRRAEIVLQNIISGNIVNPEPEEDQTNS